MGVSSSSINQDDGGGNPALPIRILRQQYFEGVDAPAAATATTSPQIHQHNSSGQSRQDESILTSGAVSTGVMYSNSQGSISQYHGGGGSPPSNNHCLLYTSDAADEEDSVDLGGRRIIKKKKNKNHEWNVDV
eukprot:TRINITY_DN21269_c0_g1_i1.p1 TRINITY_DN21269_c0_g1~~TRINITY_DN21269_c0_g1_i1.p1  ORF type:complete len:133 (-),score=15.56 TRINITY_DN21269_c0_g1_i1:51-449(-)